jgi:hypothetical protein
MASTKARDRYVTFSGLNCDGNARHLIELIRQHIEQVEPSNPWLQYFNLKLANRQVLGQDELFFVGSQISQIREFFEQVHDEEALELLDQVEEECC